MEGEDKRVTGCFQLTFEIFQKERLAIEGKSCPAHIDCPSNAAGSISIITCLLLCSGWGMKSNTGVLLLVMLLNLINSFGDFSVKTGKCFMSVSLVFILGE